MSDPQSGVPVPGSGQLPDPTPIPADDQVLEPGQVPEEQKAPDAPRSRFDGVLREIMSGSIVISILAVVLALVVGGILIAITDENVAKAAGYFFSRPSDTFQAAWNAVSGAYSSLFQGSIYAVNRPGFAAGIKPFTDTLSFATPLIAAGLGVALSFRIGLFNIGGQGQMLVAAAAAGWVGFAFTIPFPLHLILALVVGIAAGAAWAGIVGALKAFTGAHEVIVTIMLNYVAYYLLAFLLRTPGLLQAPGSNNPKSPPEKESAIFPHLFGPSYNLNIGFIFAIIATIIVWYLLNRSSLGFKFRALGENPSATRVAGINVKAMYIVGMLISGALIGLAGAYQVQGSITTGFGSGIDAGIGFDAITVALLGRSRPVGVFIAGILFGALKAGGFTMQAVNGVPIEIVLVVQSLIVLFIAAPPLVRAVFRLPSPAVQQRVKRSKLSGRKAVVTK
ncbi:ABC transporter permease [Lacisediminihabitans changchengi]|uniref:ABC transporter permease n=1 Tax=Lacisediminihabitans changchengi TaxID=2787634 RepID=A0A934SNV8_9MICO|nr:ABC transporter permease [Lacisediminihabitans changchengi]MBK4348865.1 ABC transporter permease [Lacisediminihabitans changchengi]